jgi:hypothetical protein
MWRFKTTLYTEVCLCICVYAYIYIYIYVCVCVCVCVFVCEEKWKTLHLSIMICWWLQFPTEAMETSRKWTHSPSNQFRVLESDCRIVWKSRNYVQRSWELFAITRIESMLNIPGHCDSRIALLLFLSSMFYSCFSSQGISFTVATFAS